MRFTTVFGFSAAVVCAAFLVACGGGGHSGGPAGIVPGGPQQVTNNSGPGTHITVQIHIGSGTHVNTSKRRSSTSRRTPAYLSTGGTDGLQISVAAAGVATQTVYADVSRSPLSPLCTITVSVETCVIAVPTIAASEQITVLETDTHPTNPNAGYGTGFPSDSNILAAITQTQSVTLGGSNSFGLELGMVSALFYDCANQFNPPTPLPQNASANFGADTTHGGNLLAGSRLVVTGGVAATGTVPMNLCDDDEDFKDYDTTPAPFVDVNASPTPITLSSNSSGVNLTALVNTSATAPPASAYSSSVSVPNDGYYWQSSYLLMAVSASSTFSGTATITVNNNLTALNPFLTPPASYANTMTYTVVPITVSSTSVTVAASGSTMVTGTDQNASQPMDAESAYQAEDENCDTPIGATLATISPGSLNTTTWQQPFTINAGSTTGTCTFYIYDADAGTVTLPITVTIN